MIITAIISILFAAALFANFFVVDALLRYEYRNNRHQWAADGKPCGYFWWPEGTSFFSACQFARNSCIGSWCFSTPDWIKMDKYASDLLLLIRVLYIVCFVSVGCLGSDQANI